LFSTTGTSLFSVKRTAVPVAINDSGMMSFLVSNFGFSTNFKLSFFVKRRTVRVQ
jgi:hypothetical protein